MPTLAEIRAVPKVLLHDHLDGGLRPQTVLELARETGYHDLPGDNTEELTQRLTEGAHRGHLEIYLDAFRHTVAVMQTADALRRVAAECAEDLAADGVVYAEVRFAPELHTERGLSLDEVVEAVLDGFRQGSANAARAGRGITVYALLTAMRTAARSLEIAELAVRYRDRGRGRVRHRGRRGGLAAEQAPGRVPVHQAGELPHHHPRGRGVRPAVDLGGGAVVRNRTAGPRRPHRGRHPDQPRRQRPARAAGRLHPRPPDSAGDVPDLERPDRRGAVDRAAPDPAAPPAVVPGDGEHRQPADEPGHAEFGVPPAGQQNSATAGPTSNG